MGCLTLGRLARVSKTVSRAVVCVCVCVCVCFVFVFVFVFVFFCVFGWRGGDEERVKQRGVACACGMEGGKTWN